MDIKDIVAIVDIVALADADFDDLDSIEARRALQKRHIQMAWRLEELAIRALEELEQKVAAGQPLNLTADECKTLLDLGGKLAPWVMDERMLTLLDPSGSGKPH